MTDHHERTTATYRVRQWGGMTRWMEMLCAVEWVELAPHDHEGRFDGPLIRIGSRCD